MKPNVKSWFTKKLDIVKLSFTSVMGVEVERNFHDLVVVGGTILFLQGPWILPRVLFLLEICGSSL